MYCTDISHLEALEFVAWNVLKVSHTNAYDAFGDGKAQHSASNPDQNPDSTSSVIARLGSNPAPAPSVGQNATPGYQPPFAGNNSSERPPVSNNIRKVA